MTPAHTPAPRGQVPIPPEVGEQMKEMYKLKGGITAFSKRAGIKSDTLRLAMKRGTTTARTLERLKRALEKSGVPVPVLASKGRTEPARPPAASGQPESPASPAQIEHLPPAVLRQVQRVSSALLDGMQLMQLTMLKALQEELMDGPVGPPPRVRGR